MENLARPSRILGLIFLLSTMAFLCCGPSFEGIADKLDEVAKSVEEYGTISVSSPLLFRTDTDRFKFDLRRSAQNYFDDAKEDVQGAAASFFQRAVDTQAGASFRFNFNDYLENKSLLRAYGEDVDAFRMKQDFQRAGAVLSLLGTVTSQPSIPDLSDPAAITGDIALIYLKDEQSRILSGLGSAIANLGTSFPGPTSRPGFPELPQTPPALDSPLPQSRPAKDVLVEPQFKDFQELLGDTEVAMSSGAAVEMAASHHRKQALHNFISNPEEAAKFYGKRLYFATMMVSVQPGERTYRGYRASVAMRVAAGRARAKEDADSSCDTTREGDVAEDIKESVPRASAAAVSRAGAGAVDPDQANEYEVVLSARPLVAAVTPMTEAQTLDLKSSIREQQAIALRLAIALSGMGAEGQAEVFRDFVKRLERDVATRTTLNAITSYSVAGGSFGYEIAPQLQGLADPSGENPEAGLVLQPLTFPVLVIIGIDELDIQTYNIDAIAFYQTTRWMRIGGPRPWGRGIDRLYNPRLTERDMLNRARNLAEATHDLCALQSRAPHPCDLIKKSCNCEKCCLSRTKESLLLYMGERIEMYGFLSGTSAYNWQTLDTVKLETPDIQRVQPTSIGPGAVNPIDVVLYGCGLAHADLSDPSAIQLKPAIGTVTHASAGAGDSIDLRIALHPFLNTTHVSFGIPYGGSSKPRMAYSPSITVHPPVGPRVTSIIPDKFRAGAIAEIALSGDGLSGIAAKHPKIEAMIAGMDPNAPITCRQAGGGLILTYKPPATITSPTPVAFKFEYDDNGVSRQFTTGFCLVQPAPSGSSGPVKLHRSVTVTPAQDANGKVIPNSSNTTEEVTFPPSVSSELIKRFLTTQPCCDDVEVNVSSSSSMKKGGG